MAVDWQKELAGIDPIYGSEIDASPCCIFCFALDPKGGEPTSHYDDCLWRRAVEATPVINADYERGLQDARIVLAEVLFNFYTRELGVTMHQAEHWAKPENEYPLAVHHRLRSAQEIFQIICRFDPARHPSHGEPFAEMQTALSRPEVNPPGAHPPSAELHQYSHPRFVVRRLDALLAVGIKGRG